uniref:BPTI/Kunitz inhibitor domain-containing protein n=1 Tax=Romanomermis culicivorax TaxID=13658 RepID=A0A915L999_ROMCU
MNLSIIVILLIWMSKDADSSPVKDKSDDGGGGIGTQNPKVLQKSEPTLAAANVPPQSSSSSSAVAASPSDPTLAVKKMCRLPSEAGVCSQNIKRFYYSAHSRHCMEFVYGGCNGNENNFDNITECEDTCRGVLPCPYVAWVPGCTLKQNGEDSDGCQTYEMTCEQHHLVFQCSHP